jgi:DNA-directed RNA polymerase specialized sigma24 family protein
MITIKEQLRGYRYVCAHIKALESEAKELYYKARLPTAPPPDGVKVQTQPSRDPMADIAVMYLDKIDMLKAEIMKAEQQRASIMRIIDSLAEQEKYLITQRYFFGKSWDEIAINMGYSKRHATRSHGRILGKLENKKRCP